MNKQEFNRIFADIENPTGATLTGEILRFTFRTDSYHDNHRLVTIKIVEEATKTIKTYE